MAHQFTPSPGAGHGRRRAGRGRCRRDRGTHGDGLGGSSFNYGFSKADETTLIAAAADGAKHAKIAVLLIPGIGTKDGPAARPTPAPRWSASPPTAPRPTSASSTSPPPASSGMERVGFLMMAHRTRRKSWPKQAGSWWTHGCGGVYVTDSAGAMTTHDSEARVEALGGWATRPGRLPRPPEPVAGVANTVRGDRGRAPRVDGTLCGLGAGAGNTPRRSWCAVLDKLASTPGVTSRR